MKIVVIGGVAAGPKAASRARRRDPDAEITIIEKGNLLSYAGCGLPYFISGDIHDCNELICTPAGTVRNEVFFQNVKNIKALTRTFAESIDREKQEVKVVNLESQEHFTVPYDKLILATGASHFKPPIEGINLYRIFNLGHPDDAMDIYNTAKSNDVKKAALFGAGLIGIETTEALTKQGVEVVIIEMQDQLLPRILDVETASILTRYLTSQDVEVRLSEKAVRLEGDDRSNVRKVITNKGEAEADMIITAIGVRPNIELAKNAGLKIGETGAIWVDEYLQTSDQNIYAGGDCVENTHLITGEKVYIPLGSTANKHGRIIGNNITGGSETFKGVLGTTIFKIFDYTVGCTGLSEKAAREKGYSIVTCLAPGPDTAHYYPIHDTIITKLVVNADNGKILGAQVIGPGDVDKRLDVIVTCISNEDTVKELADLDLCYAPPYSNAIDNIAHAANIIRNKMEGLAKSLSPIEVKSRIDSDEDFILLDVRTPPELHKAQIEDKRVKHIPLGKLRERIDELPRDKEIIAYCAISLRGYEAQRILDGYGFKDVKFMDGGIATWPY
ncbi:pyridine nucleotide-disulfide oxidoreductase [Candidatus Poribacteria bacterium]|nr:pyridine nucleotide-disulfide oxidoreductase [Candidatus Poribacteria bacterium]